MDRSEVITLLGETQTQNEFGVLVPERTSRDIFCQVDSVTRAEFFEGGRNGLNPEFRFTIFFGDYDGERECIYNGKPYSIYRTYHAKTDALELYAERKGGVNNVSGD
jgi:SPP1 family predicted phage head-tail adaptor